jgi:sulfite reductase (NADPH) hemoprotein beta-component
MCRCGYKIEPPRAFKFANNTDRYGWTKGANGVHHYCLFVQNGRVFDSPDYQLKTGLREIAKVC